MQIVCIRCGICIYVYISRGDARNVRVITGVRRTKRGIFGDFAWLTGPGARDYAIVTNDYTSCAVQQTTRAASFRCRNQKRLPIYAIHEHPFVSSTRKLLKVKMFTDIPEEVHFPVQCTIISLFDSWFLILEFL